MRLKEGILGAWYKGADDILDYRLYMPDKIRKPAPLAILAPGFGSSAKSPYIIKMAQAMTDKGIVVATCNYSHTRVSPDNNVDTGGLTCANASADLVRLTEVARNTRGVDGDNMAGIGVSFGGNRMLANCGKDQVGTVLVCAVPRMTQSFEQQLNWPLRAAWWAKHGISPCVTRRFQDEDVRIGYDLFKQAEAMGSAENLAACAAGFRNNVVMIVGDKDPLVSVGETRRLQTQMTNAKSARLHVIEGAGHKFEGADHFAQVQMHMTSALTEMLHLEPAPKSLRERTTEWAHGTYQQTREYVQRHAHGMQLNY